MYQAIPRSFWTGRTDPMDGEAGRRWHHIIQCVDLSEDLRVTTVPSHVLLGFCCDEGVRRNQGRVGAAKGPDAIRMALRNMACHLPENTLLLDGGNVICSGENLESAQQMLGSMVYKILKSGYKPIVLGGGHETAYGHYLGLHQFLHGAGKDSTVVNIDAHFDLRTAEAGSSGTPFRQILEMRKDGSSVDYLVLGIVESSNTEALFNTAREFGTKWMTNFELSSLSHSELGQYVDHFVSQKPYTYLSIDLDVLQESFAPGVSAPNGVGITPHKLIEVIRKIGGLGTLLSVDIVELNPNYDIQDRTAKIAAHLVYEITRLG